MSNDLVPAADTAPANPFHARSDVQNAFSGINAGAVSIEQERAIAEAQGQLILAKRFPRSVPAATAEFLDSCKSPDFAQSAFYSVPNRGTGPSIRFAEEAARVYGNFQYGHRELSRSEGKSEVEVFAWDMQNNNRSVRQITVMHVRDKQGGATKLTDQGDIDNRIANVASKQVRGRILALLPKPLVAAGIAACRQTLAGNSDKPISQRITDMTVAFSRYGVTAAMLEAYLGHPLDQTTVDELVDLHGVHTAIKEGAKASEYFNQGNTGAADDSRAQRIAEAAGEGDKPKATAKPKAQAQKPEGQAQEAQAPKAAKEAAPPAEEPSTPKEEPKAEEPTPAAEQPAAEDNQGAPASDDEAVF